MNVLVLEDNPVVQSGLVRALAHQKFSVTAAGDAMAAFAELERAVFDVIVCDIGLPIVDGISFYRQLVELHPSLSNRVLFVTAMANDPGVEAFLKATGRPVLSKPFELDELVGAVRQVAQSTPREAPVIGLEADDRAAARQIPDEFLELSGPPRERLAELIRRHWGWAPEVEQRQLGQMLIVVLDSVLHGGRVTEQLRDECENAVVGWAARQ
jgi:DNA-binding response OmpR family regulator